MANQFFLYARKSTDSEERQVLSIEAQLAELREYAAKEKLCIKEEYIEAMTAKVPGRPVFDKMVSRIQKGEADGIVAWHPDRLARNSVDGGRIVYLLDTNHIAHLKFPTFWFENTPQGKFMLNIAFGQSKYYIDNLSENVKRGIRQKLRRGEWPGWAPVGYINDKNLRKVVIDPVKGSLVRKLFEAYATGNYTLQDLRNESFKWGLVSRTGKALVKAEIHRTLTRSFYYGLMKFTKEYHEGTHEPIITKSLFDKVQDMLVRKGKPNKYRKHSFPFLGLATCPSCGCAITAERQKGHSYYRCTKKHGVCQEPYIREELLVDQINAAISRVALPSKVYQKMLAQVGKEESNARQSIARRRTRLSKEIEYIQARLDRLLDAHLDEAIDQEEYRSKKEAMLKAKVSKEEELVQAEKLAIGWLEPCEEFLKAAYQAHQVATGENLESKKEFLKKIGSNFTLSAKRLCFSFQMPWQHLAAQPAFAPKQKNQKNTSFCPKVHAGATPMQTWRPLWDKVRTYFQSEYS
ncbi:MAG: recombinase family protein [Pseudomonadota bacterium]